MKENKEGMPLNTQKEWEIRRRVVLPMTKRRREADGNPSEATDAPNLFPLRNDREIPMSFKGVGLVYEREERLKRLQAQSDRNSRE